MAFCIQYQLDQPARPCSPEMFSEAVGSEAAVKRMEMIHSLFRQAEALMKQGRTAEGETMEAEAQRQKRQQPGFIFSASAFEPHEWIDKKGVSHGVDTWRSQKHARLNGLYMVDYDHVDDPLALFRSFDLDRLVKDWGLLMAFLTASNHGLKMVLKAKLKNGNLASNQIALSRFLGVKCDKAVKDASRLSYAPAKQDMLYFDKQIFDYEDQEYIRKYQNAYSDGSSEPDLFQEEPEEAGEKTPEAEPETESEDEKTKGYEDYTYEGLKIPDIINKWLEGEAPDKGKRHKTLLWLTDELRYVCDRDSGMVRYWLEKMPWVQTLRKEGDPVDATIKDGLAYKFSKWMPKKMKDVVDSLKGQEVKDDDKVEGEDDFTHKYTEWGEEIESLFDDYPCLKEICHGLVREAYPAALYVGGALFGTLATRTWYYFYHEPEYQRRLNYEIFVIADPAKGKSFASKLYKTILSPMIAKDKLGNDAINKYKKNVKQFQNSSEKAKKDNKIVYPEVKIRIHGARTANGVFIEDMNNCVEIVDGTPMHLHMFTFDSELDSATSASKGGYYIDKSNMELKAFHNEEDNQQYRNIDSVNGPFDVYWNFVYTGTPHSLSKKVNLRNFGTGLFSRLGVIPLVTPDFEMMKFAKRSKVNHTVMETLKEWAYRMDEVKGELPAWPLVESCWNWVNDIMTIAKEEKDKVASLLVRRVPYYGLNVSLPFILMRHWKEWQEKRDFKVDATDKRLCEMIMEIQYFNQRLFFGKYAKSYYDDRQVEENENKKSYDSKNKRLLDTMPQDFTYELLKQKTKWSSSYASKVVSRWINEGLVKRSGFGKNMKIVKL